MNSPLVSVVVPTYKRPDYLSLTLASIKNQSYKNLEIIVVDDGTEGDINQKICDSFDKVAYKKIENSGGPAKPRNQGIKLAKGTYISFVDDDDIWLPTKIEKQVALLEQHKQFGLVHGPCQIIDENGHLKDQVIGRPGSHTVKHGDVKLKMMGNWTLMMPTPLLRRNLLEKVGFFNESIPAALEDVEFWVRCSFEGLFYYCDDPLVLYRKHSANISTNRKKYVVLPLYLNAVRKNQIKKGTINTLEAKQLLTNLCAMQLKMLKFSKIRPILNLFVLDAFWFVKFPNLKILIKYLLP